MRLTLFSLAIVSALLAACSGSADTGGLANGGASTGGATETPKPPALNGGATSRPEQTPPAPPATPDQASCDVSFSKDVLPSLAQHGCQSAQCHGGVQQPKISVIDAKATYASVTQFKMREGLPYVRTTGRPDESGIHCHVRNDCGTPMPPFGGKIDEDAVDVIDDWLKCGAPNN